MTKDQSIFTAGRPYRLPYSKNDNPNGWLEITTFCNMNCPGCYRGCHLKDTVKVHEPLAKLKKEIDALVEIRNCQIISISGGEPLMHPDLLEIVRYISAKGLTPLLHTNGLLLTRELLLKLKDAGLVSVHIRIDSLMTPEKTGTEAGLNRERQRFASLVEQTKGLNLGFICVVSRENLHELPDVVEWFREDQAHGDFLTVIPIRDAMFPEEGRTNPDNWVSLDELHDVLSRSFDGIEYCSYLGSQLQNKTFRWLQASWVMLGQQRLAFLSGKSTELFQFMTHFRKGRYSYLVNEGPNHVSFFQILALGLFLADFRMVVRKMALAIARDPGLIFQKTRIQVLSITIPPGTVNGQIDMCDACPDAMLYRGELVPSCALERIKALADGPTDWPAPVSPPPVTPLNKGLIYAMRTSALLDNTTMYRLPYSKNDNPNGWIEVTTACNMKCPGCYKGIDRGDRPVRHEPLERIKQDILELKRIRNCGIITISGGEALMHPDIDQIVRFVKAQGLSSFIHTNGLLLDQGSVRRLKQAGLTGLIVRVDVNNRPDFDSEAKLEVFRDRIADLVFREGGLQLGLTCVVTKKNLRQVPDIVGWFQARNRKADYLVLILKREFCFESGKMPDHGDEISMDEIVQTLRDAYPDMLFPSYLGAQHENVGFKWVQSGWISLKGTVLGYADARMVELFTMMGHFKNGNYSYVTRQGRNRVSTAQMIGGSLVLRSMRRVLARYAKALLKDPSAIFQPPNHQVINIVNPPSGDAGTQDFCDACPDAILYQGQLQPSCILESIKQNKQDRE